MGLLKQLDFEEKQAKYKTLGQNSQDTELVSAIVPESKGAKKHEKEEQADADAKAVVARADSWNPQDVVSADDQKKAQKHFDDAAKQQNKKIKAGTDAVGSAVGSARHHQDVAHAYDNRKMQWTNRQVVGSHDMKHQGHRVVREAAEKSKIKMEADKEKKKDLEITGPSKSDKKDELPKDSWPINGGNPPWTGGNKPKDADGDKNPFHEGMTQQLAAGQKMPPAVQDKATVQDEATVDPTGTAAADQEQAKSLKAESTPPPPPAASAIGMKSGYVDQAVTKDQNTHKHQIQKAQAQEDAAVDKELKHSPQDEVLLGMPPPAELVSHSALKAQVDAVVADSYRTEKEAKPKDFLNEPTEFGPWLMN